MECTIGYSEPGVFCTKLSHVVVEYPNGPGWISKVKCVTKSRPSITSLAGPALVFFKPAILKSFFWVYLTVNIKNLYHAVAFAICSKCAVMATQKGDLT